MLELHEQAQEQGGVWEVVKVYTIREAARETKIGMEPLKRACEEKLINATRLSNGQWRIAESALAEALHNGLDFQSLPKKATKKRLQPEGLRKAQEAMRKAKTKTTIDAKLAAASKAATTKKTPTGKK